MPDLWHGDCLEILRYIPDHSVDLVLTDPPYGTTDNQWDTPLDLAAIWPQLRRVGRPTTPVLLFAQLPFLADVAISNRAELRYAWVCEKGNATGFLNANRAPMKAYEQVLVFYRAAPKYNPQMEKGDPYIKRPGKGKKSSNYNGHYDDIGTVSDGRRYPRDIISKDKWSWAGETLVHPTQKPVRLLEYLICTYTDPGDTVLDFTMGSGSTGVACVRTGRNFIGIERDADYFATAKKRIAEAVEIKELEDAQTTIGGM